MATMLARRLVDRYFCRHQLIKTTTGAVTFGGSGLQNEIVSACFSFDAVAAEPLFRSIPALVHFSLNEKLAALIRATLDLIGLDTNASEHGSAFVVDRLLATLFVQALRAQCSNETVKTNCWLAGLGDRRLARTIHAVHSDLARQWTVEDMAQEAGLSRSSFAALFISVVGEARRDYLTGWRVYRVKMVLTATDEGLLRIAKRIGHDNDLSLSRVFKRRTGIHCAWTMAADDETNRHSSTRKQPYRVLHENRVIRLAMIK